MHNTSDTHPSKVFKYCPKCGNDTFRFDNEKLFICKTCGFNYYINPVTAVCGIIVLNDGNIILTRRKNNPQAGMLDLPGGFVDIMERAEDAIIREIKEELDLTVTSLELIATFPNEYVYKGITYYTCDIAFVCKVDAFSAVHPADDVTEAIIIDPTKIDYNEVGFNSIINVLKYYSKTRSINS